MTGTVLDTIVADTRLRVNFERTVRPLPEIREACMVRPRRTGFPFERNLGTEGMSFICEVKKASPSKGVISEDFPYLEIAREYESLGASAISVLSRGRTPSRSTVPSAPASSRRYPEGLRRHSVLRLPESQPQLW